MSKIIFCLVLTWIVLVMEDPSIANGKVVESRPYFNLQVMKSDATESVMKGSSSTSPTISVERFGASTFYSYVNTVPTEEPVHTTNAEVIETSTKGLLATEKRDLSSKSSSSSTSIENGSGSRSGSSSASESSSGSDSNSDEDDESAEDVSEKTEDDATVHPTSTLPDVENRLTDAPPASSDNVEASETVPAVPAPGDPSESNGPTDQTPPPAEAVPGQPGEADADNSSSSSSSEESSSSSSSSEEYQKSYRVPKKVWARSYQLKMDDYNQR